jgi:hypothetical protein
MAFSCINHPHCLQMRLLDKISLEIACCISLLDPFEDVRRAQAPACIMPKTRENNTNGETTNYNVYHVQMP